MRRNGRFKGAVAGVVATLRTARLITLGATLAVAASGAALAARSNSSDDGYFVKRGATADAFFTDRDACRREAASLGDSPDAYSDPRYGALRAMGQAIDSDALHGGLRKRMLAAVFNDCMRRRDWSPLDPAPTEAKALKRASPKRPKALDAWLKAHEPEPVSDQEPAPAGTPAAETPRPSEATPPRPRPASSHGTATAG